MKHDVERGERLRPFAHIIENKVGNTLHFYHELQIGIC